MSYAKNGGVFYTSGNTTAAALRAHVDLLRCQRHRSATSASRRRRGRDVRRCAGDDHRGGGSDEFDNGNADAVPRPAGSKPVRQKKALGGDVAPACGRRRHAFPRDLLTDG